MLCCYISLISEKNASSSQVESSFVCKIHTSKDTTYRLTYLQRGTLYVWNCYVDDVENCSGISSGVMCELVAGWYSVPFLCDIVDGCFCAKDLIISEFLLS